MSQEERYGTRCNAYSAWHRARSIARYVGLERAQTLSMLDLDVITFLEVARGSREPLALIEVAKDCGQAEKPASSVARLAERAGLPAFTVLYRCAGRPNPADPTTEDIDSVRVKRLWPSPEHGWRQLSPAAWAKALIRIREWSAARVQAAANDELWEPIPTQVDLFQERQA